MKILYHHRTRGDGAEGVHIAEIVAALRDLGHDVEVVCPRTARRKPGLSRGAIRASGGRGAGVKTVFKQIAEVAYNVVSYLRVYRGITKHRPAFVYERYSAFNFAGVMAARHWGVPLILEVNATYAGRFGSRFPVYFPRLMRWAESYSLRQSSGLVVVSQALKECVKSHQSDESRINVSPNAINVAKVNAVDVAASRAAMRDRFKLAQDSIIIGFVGSLRKWHGLDLFADVIPLVAEKVPNARFMIVGSGEYEEPFRAMLGHHRVSDRVTFVGPVAHDEILAHVAAMDIGVMPDSNEFGSPMKILEYMALGCVPVAPRIGPIEEIVQHRETGCLFRRRNEAEFAEELIALATDDSFRCRLSRNATAYVISNHRWEKNAQDIVRLYERTLELSPQCV